MPERRQLNEKDLHCIARTFQGMLYEDSMHYGCRFCKYAEECYKTVENNGELYFDVVKEKLQNLTGLYMGICYDPAKPEETFTKGTEKKNDQKKRKCSAIGKILQKLRWKKIRFIYWNHYFHPFTHISTIHCYNENGCYQNSYLQISKGSFGKIKVLARVPYDKDKIWIRNGYKQGFIGELVAEEDRIERSKKSKI